MQKCFKHSGQASKMDLLVAIVNDLKLKLLTSFSKRFQSLILEEVLNTPQYISGQFQCRQLIECFTIHEFVY